MKSKVPLANFPTLGELLKFLRRRAQLSQRELSIAVGYSESHLSRIESNERPLDRTSLLALFVPALYVENEPEVVNQLLMLCDAPTITKPTSPLVTSSQLIKNTYLTGQHLPRQLTSFIGRNEEIDEISELLHRHDVRLLTLTGMGGCGKTRLALQVGEKVANRYEHRVWFVELATLTTAQLLPRTVATVLGLHKTSDETALTDLIDYLAPRQLLLIVDNCEHLVEAVAQLSVALLHACSRLQILATSREALGIPGEIVYWVQPLALPPAQRGLRLSPSDIIGYDAVQLFVARAQAAMRNFALRDQNAAAVARICQRLDGIPLGIELAAAWVNLLSPEQIASRLTKDLDLLVDQNRTVLPRHRTLHAAIEWSYNLLAETDRILLRRLAIFVGGWRLEGAETVVAGCEAEGPLFAGNQVLPLLRQLVNKSLVVVEHPEESVVRFRLLEPLCEYLKEKLGAAGEQDKLAHCHLLYYVNLTERLDAQTCGSAHAVALATLDRELDNLRSALTWGFRSPAASKSDHMQVVSLVTQLGRYWYMRQHWGEGRDWLTKALTLVDSLSQEILPVATSQLDMAGARAKLLFLLGYLAEGQGDLSTACTLLEQSLRMQRYLADQAGIARTLQELGAVASEQGDYARATALLTESLDYACSLGNDWLCAISLGKLADVAGEQNDFARCEELSSQFLTLAQQLGDIGMHITALNLLAQCAIATNRFSQAIALLEEAIALNQQGNPHSRGSPWAFRNLGLALQLSGDYERAADYYRRSLLLRRERQQISGMAWALEGLGEVIALSGHPKQAVQMWGAAASLRRRAGSVMSDSDRLRNESIVTAVRSQLGSQIFETAWTEGETMSIEQVIDETLKYMLS